MLNRISQHPFPVEAYFNYSLVLSYAYPVDALQNRIPDCLELDTFQDRWAFVAVAMVQTRHLRPKGFPKFLGNAFFLAGYRIFVRYTSESGRRLRGLYILRSETDKPKMRILGNLFTNYNYSTIKVSADFISGESARIESPSTGLKLVAKLGGNDEANPLPETSPFANWREARRFAGPMPFTFSVNPKEVVIVEGKRSQWQPRPIQIEEASVPYLKSISSAEPFLANAFVTENIPYEWTRGRRESRK
jgi:uncharacterized protein YqjF (DUF2071 family)